MFIYKSEILKTTSKWFSHSANEEDVSNLDKLINKRATEGWELVTYSYIENVWGMRSAILVTFRKPK